MRERRRNWRTLAIAVLLMLTVTATTLAVGSYYRAAESPENTQAPELPEVPAVTILGTRVTGDRYFELSLVVSAKSFQSAGAVLSFDTSVLCPVDWSGGKLEVPGRSWASPSVFPTKGADNLSGKPALSYLEADGEDQLTGRGVLYLGADALQYTQLDEVQAVTVRFAYVDGKGPEDVTMPTAEALGQGAKSPFTVEYAGEDTLTDSIPGAKLVTTTDADHAYELRESYPGQVRFKLADGPGVSGSGGGAGGDYAITFFDWDGRVIDAMAAQGDMTAAVEAFQEKQAVLKGKKGYDFSCWLLVEQGEAGLETKHGAFVAAAEASAFDSDRADFSAVSGNLLVQAAYVENASCNSGVSDGTKIDYTIDQRNAVYTRYGSASGKSGRYSITYPVSRLNGAGQGVTKLRQPAVFVVMVPDLGDPSKNLISRIDLDNTDETTFEVVPTREIQSVEVYIIDTYGVAAWPAAGGRSGTIACGNSVFVEMGSWGFVRDQAIETLKTLGDDCLDESRWSTAWVDEADEDTFRDGGLTVTVDLVEAKKRILTAMKGLTAEQRAAVTQADLQQMISGGYLPPAE